MSNVVLGVGFSSEELEPQEIVRCAAEAEHAGAGFVTVSDHFHPWIDAQGESPFVWSVLGGIAQVTERVRVGTAVTCPCVRMHPALVAQASATAAVMFEGRFFLGVGTGENLNEHVTGARWPTGRVRLHMLEEAIEIIRELWSGRWTTRHGEYFTVEAARLYTRPDEAPPVYVAAANPDAARLAGRCGDGLVNTAPDDQIVDAFNGAGGEGRPKLAQIKVCWARTEDEGLETAHQLWPNSGLSGGASWELPLPSHFEQATQTVRREDMAKIPCGPDPEPYRAAIELFADAGFDHIYLTQIGPDQQGFIDFFAEHLATVRVA